MSQPSQRLPRVGSSREKILTDVDLNVDISANNVVSFPAEILCLSAADGTRAPVLGTERGGSVNQPIS